MNGYGNAVRYFTIALPISGALVAGADRVGIELPTRLRILEGQLYLRSSGTGAGNTDVVVNKNGVAIFPAVASGGLRIASAAGTRRIRVKPVAAAGHPSGLQCEAGDYITVDVSAIPGTTASADGVVYLLCAAQDV